MKLSYYLVGDDNCSSNLYSSKNDLKYISYSQ